VTCILNTIDDALDRSDPGGTEWGADAVRHLTPLLARAQRAGRIVVLTADHGHIVERRQGSMRSYPTISSGRSREASVPAGEGEVLVTGRRVVAPGNRAVLAVDEQLRYGPLKAGYHGGAAPAEVVVPVVLLVHNDVPPDTDLELASPQEPAWWDAPLSPAGSALSPLVAEMTRQAATEPPTLFDEVAAEPTSVVLAGAAAAAAVVSSETYQDQRRLGARLPISDDQVRALLAALLATPAGRLPAQQTAVVLGIALTQVRGALAQAQQLLNVEGYGVLTLDVDGSTLVVDRALLRDQFGVDT
jgi:hypothetical protein